MARVSLSLRARGPNRRPASGPHQLERRGADPAADGLDQHGFSSPEAGLGHESVVGRDEGLRKRRGILESQRGGNSHQHPVVSHQPCGLCAAADDAHDPVADSTIRTPCRQALDLAGEFHPGYVGG